MRRIANWRNFPILAGVLVGLAATPAQALVIVPVFGTDITSLGNAGAIEASINTAIATIDGLIANPLTIDINFDGCVPGASGCALGAGGLGGSSQTLTGTSYTTVQTALATDANNHPSNTVLATAVAHLPTGSTVEGRSVVYMTKANAAVLGLAAAPTGAAGTITLSTATSGNTLLDFSTVLGAGNTDAIRVIEHEIDEILGIGGPGSTLGTGVSSFAVGMTDLYRYASPGTLSYTTLGTATAYFSINGGTTNLVAANQSSSGDYADFAQPNGTCVADVQEAFTCQNQAAAVSASSPESTLLQAVGYTLNQVLGNTQTTVPEPGSIAILSGAFAALGAIRRRRRLR